MSSGGGTKAIVAAFAANLGIAVAKFVGFLLTGASSLLAESVHSLADTGNQGLLLLGRRRSRRAPDEDHPFGYGRERFFWAFVVALVLFSLGSLFAVYEGIHKVQHPERIDSVGVALGLLSFAIAAESFSLRTAVQEASGMRRGGSWLGFIRRSKNPELPVVLLEDVGALFGLVVAFVALLLAWKVDPIWDGIGTLVIGGLLGVIAVVLAIEMKSLLIGEAAAPDDVRRIVEAVESHELVNRLIHMKTEHLGPDEILVAAKVAFVPDLDVPALARAIDDTEARVRAEVPEARLIYIEPDLDRFRVGDAPVHDHR